MLLAETVYVFFLKKTFTNSEIQKVECVEMMIEDKEKK